MTAWERFGLFDFDSKVNLVPIVGDGGVLRLKK